VVSLQPVTQQLPQQPVDANNFKNAIIYMVTSVVLSGIISWVLTSINKRFEIKKIKVEAENSEKRYNESNRLVSNRMLGMENSLVDVSFNLLEMKKSNEFERNLTNAIQDISTNIIDFNDDIKPRYKHILTQMSREFENFISKFYRNPGRGVSHRIVPFLKSDMNSRLSILESLLGKIDVGEVKAFTLPSTKKIPVNVVEFVLGFKNQEDENNFKGYLDFPDENDLNGLMKIIKLLIFDLEKNGLTPEKFIERIEEFYSEFFKKIVLVFREWEKLELYKKEDSLTPKNIWDEFNELNIDESKDIEYVKNLEKRKIK
jgi:hypothetical protein